MAMKIAYLVNQYPYVSLSFVRREILALEELGFEIERFAVRKATMKLVDPVDIREYSRTRILLDQGILKIALAVIVTCITMPILFFRALLMTLRMGRHSGRGLVVYLAYLAEACLLLPMLRKSGVSHLHTHFGTNATNVALLAKMLGGPSYSFTIHGPEEFDRPEQLSLGLKIERASFVVCISDYGRSQAFRWCDHSHWHKIEVVHCGVDDSFLGEGPQPVPLNNRMVCVGRLTEQKGQIILLQTLGLLKKEGVSFDVTLAGDGPMRKQVEDEISRLGLNDNVHITGWVSGEQVRKLLLDCRLMVLPSFAEGLPVVIMEALALGRPVISTYVAGIPELVVPGKNGWLVPPGSTGALAGAIREGLEAGQDTLNRMGQNGASSVAKNHDIRNEAAHLAELFQKVEKQGT